MIRIRFDGLAVASQPGLRPDTPLRLRAEPIAAGAGCSSATNPAAAACPLAQSHPGAEPASLQHDIVLADHVAPALALLLDEDGHLGGRAADRLDAHRAELGLHV